MKYTTKEDAVNKGLCKKNNVIYRKTVLERWYDKGWLELPNSKYSSDERLYFGMKLAHDYYLISKSNLHSGFIENTRVDIGIKTNGFYQCDAVSRYSKAIKTIPAEFWPIVRQICVDDCEPVILPKMSERQTAYQYFLWRNDLCRGLDRLAVIYN